MAASIEDIWFDEEGAGVFVMTSNGVVWRWTFEGDKLARMGRVERSPFGGKMIVKSDVSVATQRRLRIHNLVEVYSLRWSKLRQFNINGDVREISRNGHFIVVVSERRDMTKMKVYSVGGYNAGDYKLEIMDAVTGAIVQTFYHGAEFGTVAFSEDGRFVAAAGSDGVNRVWEIKSGNEVGRIVGVGQGLRFGFFSAASALAMTSEGNRRRVVVAQLGASAIIEEICRRSVRNLTSSERRDYLPGESERATCPDL
jgi:WD40 repeat protein